MNIKKRFLNPKKVILATSLICMTLSAGKVYAFPFITLSLFNSSNSSQLSQVEKISFNPNSQNTEVLEPINNVDPILSTGGAEITLVENKALYAENAPLGTSIENSKTNNGGKISIYEVREGDTISQIADMFDVSVNTIRWANDLSGDIKPGQTLTILPVTGVKHIVKNGGTIKDIAKIYEADAREIALFNGLSEDSVLKAGQEIIVPHAELKQEDSKPKGQSKTFVKKGSSVNTGVSSAKGYYGNPVPGAILTQGIHGYNGIDLGAPVGTPIYAAAAGTVITSKQGGWNGGYGSMIVISHDNGTQTLYSHQSENTVYVGQTVKKGELIGYIGSTGKSTGPHLHFEVRGAKNPIASACVVGKVCRY